MTTTHRQNGKVGTAANVVELRITPDLRRRRSLILELPEFLVRALEQRVAEANADALLGEDVTLQDYIEYELAKLISVSEIAEMELLAPGFADAVREWVLDMCE